MRKNINLIFAIITAVFDVLTIFLSYYFAYFIRTHLDTRPFFFGERPVDFFSTLVFLIPLWFLILAALGLYKKKSLTWRGRSGVLVRLLFASILGTMSIITIAYFKAENIFPVRPVAAYTAILCFVFLVLFRSLIHLFRRIFLKKGRHGKLSALIIGENENTTFLADYISKNPESGYTVSGIIAKKSLIPSGLHTHIYSSLKTALEHCSPDIIFQTDAENTEYVYRESLNHHIPYYFVPSEAALSSQLGDLELIGSTPAILVKVTPLAGWASFVKRTFDIFIGFILTVLALIPMLVIWLVVKLSDIHHSAFYSETRLTRHNREFRIYKFRSMKPEFSGMSPEDAFRKMGKEDLIKKYRDNGDYLEDDPRITRVGRFIRRTSLDELPQLFNILKGDISLVGPRALVPGELRDYGDRSLLLSVKSGLTGLAQVSGRRNISFAERRALDIYYIQNWSLFLDLHILLKTVLVVFKGEGAK